MNIHFLLGISALISMALICLALYFLSRKIKMGSKRYLSEAYVMMAFLLFPVVVLFLAFVIFRFLRAW